MTDFRQIRTREELDRLVEAAKADAHRVVLATHVVEKDGEIVGYGSINAAPTINLWLDSKKVKPLDSIRLLHRLTDGLSFTGARHVLMPCADNSPFAPIMPQLGFEPLGHTTLYLKGL